MSQEGQELAIPFSISLRENGIDIRQLLPSFSIDTLRLLHRGHLIPEKVFRDECGRRLERNQALIEKMNRKARKE